MDELAKKMLYVMGVVALIQNGANADTGSPDRFGGNHVAVNLLAGHNPPPGSYTKSYEVTVSSPPSSNVPDWILAEKWKVTLVNKRHNPWELHHFQGSLMDTPIAVEKRHNGLLRFHVAGEKLYEGTEIHFPAGWEYWPGFTLNAPLDINQNDGYETAFLRMRQVRL